MVFFLFKTVFKSIQFFLKDYPIGTSAFIGMKTHKMSLFQNCIRYFLHSVTLCKKYSAEDMKKKYDFNPKLSEYSIKNLKVL
mgnify:CR=1 FL=1